jgi:hypothetical protein
MKKRFFSCPINQRVSSMATFLSSIATFLGHLASDEDEVRVGCGGESADLMQRKHFGSSSGGGG